MRPIEDLYPSRSFVYAPQPIWRNFATNFWVGRGSGAARRTYVRQFSAFANRNVTLHGLRSSCAISLAIAGAKLEAIMDHVGWKSSKSARHFIKLNQVLGHGGATDTLSSLEVDLAKVYKQYNNLHGFTIAFWTLGLLSFIVFCGNKYYGCFRM